MNTLDDEFAGEDAFSSLEGIMTAEEALASLDADFDPSTIEGLSELDNIDEDEQDPEVFSSNEEISVEDQEEIQEIEEEIPADIIEEEFVTAQEVIEEVTMEEEVEMKEDIVIQPSGSENIGTEITVITKGTTIRGGISSDCSLEVMGVITGDVDCQGKLSIYGTVSGNTTASEIYVETPQKLNGDLKSTGCVNVAEGSVVIGTISAASAHISGAIKGDIEVAGPVIVDETAVVLGNITAKSLQLNNGAVIEGICTVSENTTDINALFD